MPKAAAVSNTNCGFDPFAFARADALVPQSEPPNSESLPADLHGLRWHTLAKNVHLGLMLAITITSCNEEVAAKRLQRQFPNQKERKRSLLKSISLLEKVRVWLKEMAKIVGDAEERLLRAAEDAEGKEDKGIAS